MYVSKTEVFPGEPVIIVQMTEEEAECLQTILGDHKVQRAAADLTHWETAAELYQTLNEVLG
jgi:hypothetical protein